MDPGTDDGGEGAAVEAAAGWEKCARQLTLNTPAVLQEFLQTAIKILSNISAHPEETKYKALKLSNKGIEARVLAVKGGLQYFLACGFVRSVSDTGDKIITLADPSLEGELEEDIDWLRATTESCLQLAAQARGKEGDPCANCIIQLKFSSGLPPVLGGFSRHSTLEAVLSYARCFFTPQKQSDVVLFSPESPAPLEDLSITLQQAGLAPRASLIATTTSRDARVGKMQEIRTEVVFENTTQIENAERARQNRMRTAKERQEQRVQILSDFEMDHEERSKRR